MRKAINIENSSKQIVRVLSIAEPDILENNSTSRGYILITNYVEPPVVDNHMVINYPMWDKINQTFKWAQIQYQNTATEELLEIENLKFKNNILKNQLQTANENIDMPTETIADIIGGAI